MNNVVSYRVFAEALRAVIAQPDLRRQLQSRETADQAAAELRIDKDARIELLDLLNELPVARSNGAAATGPVSDARPPAGPSWSDEIKELKTAIHESFAQIKRSYRASMAMSITIFVVGLGFLAIAGWIAITRPADAITTAIVAGTGLVPLVTLFYRNPLGQIARGLANAQRGTLIFTTYILGIGMLSDQVGHDLPTTGSFKTLADLSAAALDRLPEGASS
jgi:hypothetical protein